MTTYYTLITEAGQALLAEAIASGEPVLLTEFAVGDGDGLPVTPDAAMTGLVNEVYRGGIGGLEVSTTQPDALAAQLIVPKESGGYTVREVALFADDGTMFSIGNYPDQPKPLPDSGYAVKLDMRFVLVVSDTSAITVIIPPGDYLTQEEADTLYLQIGNNLSEIADNGGEAQEAARDNLGLGSAATSDADDFLPSDTTASDIDALPITGGTLTGSLIIKTDNTPLLLRPVTTGRPVYLLLQEANGTSSMYLGKELPNSGDIVLTNYAGGNKLRLKSDGTTELVCPAGKNVTTTNQFVPGNYGNFDARYVRNAQLGAEYSKGYGGGSAVKADPGGVLIGLLEEQDDNEIHAYYFQPVQVYINGAWATIAG